MKYTTKLKFRSIASLNSKSRVRPLQQWTRYPVWLYPWVVRNVSITNAVARGSGLTTSRQGRSVKQSDGWFTGPRMNTKGSAGRVTTRYVFWTLDDGPYMVRPGHRIVFRLDSPSAVMRPTVSQTFPSRLSYTRFNRWNAPSSGGAVRASVLSHPVVDLDDL